MASYIIFEDGTEFLQPEKAQAPIHALSADGRTWRRIAITNATIDEAKAAFINGAEYRHEWDSKTYNENGEEITERLSEDLSAFSIAGDIVDTRNGDLLVYMAKPNELDIANAELAAAEAAMQEGVNSINE